MTALLSPVPLPQLPYAVPFVTGFEDRDVVFDTRIQHI